MTPKFSIFPVIPNIRSVYYYMVYYFYNKALGIKQIAVSMSKYHGIFIFNKPTIISLQSNFIYHDEGGNYVFYGTIFVTLPSWLAERLPNSIFIPSRGTKLVQNHHFLPVTNLLLVLIEKLTVKVFLPNLFLWKTHLTYGGTDPKLPKQ